MRYVIFTLCAVVFMGSAMAQTSSEPELEQPRETPIESERPDTEQKLPEAPETDNLDDFFEEGREQAEEGSGCSIPVEPVA